MNDAPWASEPSHELTNPGTSATRLHQLAQLHPEYAAQIAAHPNCYPELQQWLSAYAPVVESSPSTPPTTAQGTSRPRRLMKTIGIASAVVIPFITAATIAIPMIAKLTEKETSVDTFAVISKPDATYSNAEVIGEETTYESELEFGEYYKDWQIPADAPMVSFPSQFGGDAPNFQCSQEQLDWLHEHAQPIIRMSSGFTLTLHNSASTGAALPLGNIRFIGEEVGSTPLVYFDCLMGGRGATGGSQPALIDVTGDEAIYGEPLDASGEAVMPEGSPVTINLGPGEVQVLTLTRSAQVDMQRAYEGKFVADVIDGSQRTVVLADNIRFERSNVPGFAFSATEKFSGAAFAPLAGTLHCGRDPDLSGMNFSPCSSTEAVEFLKEAAGTVGG